MLLLLTCCVLQELQVSCSYCAQKMRMQSLPSSSWPSLQHSSSKKERICLNSEHVDSDSRDETYCIESHTECHVMLEKTGWKQARNNNKYFFIELWEVTVTVSCFLHMSIACNRICAWGRGTRLDSSYYTHWQKSFLPYNCTVTTGLVQ